MMNSTHPFDLPFQTQTDLKTKLKEHAQLCILYLGPVYEVSIIF